MGEKRGNTGKLKYDFNTAWVCEIFMGQRWFRVLEKDFRSFNGPRRITKPIRVELGNPFVGNETFDYEGPYYYYNTNTLFDPNQEEQGKIVYPDGKEREPAKPTSVAKL